MTHSICQTRLRCAQPIFLGAFLLLMGLFGAGCGSSGAAQQGRSAAAAEATSNSEATTASSQQDTQQASQELRSTTVEDPIKVLRLPKVQDRLENAAQDWYGTPYDWGGETKEGVDCSGFVQNLYKDAFAYGLPRVTETQLQSGPTVERDQIRPGDLVFFQPEDQYNHVGVYLGDGTFVHASSSDGVTDSELDNNYWDQYYWTARRPLKPATIPDTLSSELLAYKYPDSDSTVQVAEASEQPQSSDEENADPEQQTDQTSQASDAEASEGTKIASCDAEGVDCTDPSSAETSDSDDETTRKGW